MVIRHIRGLGVAAMHGPVVKIIVYIFFMVLKIHLTA